jgi:hypothetical protein
MATLNYGVVERPKPGNYESGDAWRVIESLGEWLIAVADGLGSGPAAARASRAAMECLATRPGEPLIRLLEACDQALQGTRGAAIGLLRVRPAEHYVAFAGVGNIEVRTVESSDFRPISTNGIVGGNYRAPKLFEAEYRPSEWLVIHSDGLRHHFDLDRELREPFGAGKELAERLAASHAREADDLTVIAVQLPQGREV